MILECYSIKDELNGYTVPIPMVNDAVAKRYFHGIGYPTCLPRSFILRYLSCFFVKDS